MPTKPFLRFRFRGRRDISCVVEKLSRSYFSAACILAKSSANKSRQVFLDIEKAKSQTKYEHLIISASI